MSFSISEVYAIVPLTPSIAVSPSSGPVGSTITVTGTGFAPGTTIVIFLDTTNTDSVTIADDGTFTIDFAIPTSLGPGPITVSVADINNLDFILASAPFLITSISVPEFPFAYSMIIMFVAVAAVYMGIRQKMSLGFKPF